MSEVKHISKGQKIIHRENDKYYLSVYFTYNNFHRFDYENMIPEGWKWFGGGNILVENIPINRLPKYESDISFVGSRNTLPLMLERTVNLFSGLKTDGVIKGFYIKIYASSEHDW